MYKEFFNQHISHNTPSTASYGFYVEREIIYMPFVKGHKSFLTPESKKKISKSLTGLKQSPEHIAKRVVGSIMATSHNTIICVINKLIKII